MFRFKDRHGMVRTFQVFVNYRGVQMVRTTAYTATPYSEVIKTHTLIGKAE